jgi:hypothetical protein
MTYNLFIAYDLVPPGQNYQAVCERIRELGPSYRFQYSLWYVNTRLNPNEAFEHVKGAIDISDKLIVINAQSGVTTDWDQPPIEAINAIWFRSSGYGSRYYLPA